jgi:hypothetical protein
MDKMFHEEDELPDEIRKALIDRYEGWELVELLGIDIRDIIDNFEMEIMDYLPELKEELGITDEPEEDNEDGS